MFNYTKQLRSATAAPSSWKAQRHQYFLYGPVCTICCIPIKRLLLRNNKKKSTWNIQESWSINRLFPIMHLDCLQSLAIEYLIFLLQRLYATQCNLRLKPLPGSASCKTTTFFKPLSIVCQTPYATPCLYTLWQYWLAVMCQVGKGWVKRLTTWQIPAANRLTPDLLCDSFKCKRK